MILKKIKDLDKPKYPDGFVTHYIIDDRLGANIFKYIHIMPTGPNSEQSLHRCAPR